MFYSIFQDINKNCEALNGVAWDSGNSKKSLKNWMESIISQLDGITFSDLIKNDNDYNYYLSIAQGHHCIVLENVQNENHKKYLKIVKKGEETEHSGTYTKPLSGIGFQLLTQIGNDENGNPIYQYIDANGNKTNVPTTFYTDGNGELVIYNLDPNTYYDIYEVEILNNGRGQENYGYVLENGPVLVKKGVYISDSPAVSGLELSSPITNPLNFGRLYIQKIDKDTNEVLPGIKFKIQKVGESGYLRAVDNKYIYDASEEAATEFITDSYGAIEIHNLEFGTYRLVEQETNKWATDSLDTYVEVIKNPSTVGESTAVASILKNNITDKNTMYEDLFDLLVRRDRKLWNVEPPEDFEQVVIENLIRNTKEIKNSSKFLEFLETIIKNVSKYKNKNKDAKWRYLKDEVNRLTIKLEEISNMSREEIQKLADSLMKEKSQYSHELDGYRRYEQTINTIKTDIERIEKELAYPNITETRKEELERQKDLKMEELKKYETQEKKINELKEAINKIDEEYEELDISVLGNKKTQFERKLEKKEEEYSTLENTIKGYYDIYFMEKNIQYRETIYNLETMTELPRAFESVIVSMLRRESNNVVTEQEQKFKDAMRSYESCLQSFNNRYSDRDSQEKIMEFIELFIEMYKNDLNNEVIQELTNNNNESSAEPDDTNSTVVEKIKILYKTPSELDKLNKELKDIEKNIQELKLQFGYDPNGERQKQLGELEAKRIAKKDEIRELKIKIQELKEELHFDQNNPKVYDNFIEGLQQFDKETDENQNYVYINVFEMLQERYPRIYQVLQEYSSKYNEEIKERIPLEAVVSNMYYDIADNNHEYTYLNEMNLLMMKYHNRYLYSYEVYYFNRVSGRYYNYVIIKNMRKLQLIVKKVDKYTQKPIEGIQFELFGSDSAGNIDINNPIYDSGGQHLFSTWDYTDENGNMAKGGFVTGYLKQGIYYLREVGGAQIPYEVPEVPYGDVKIELYADKVTVGDYVIKTVTNEKSYFKLQVKKIDRDTQKPIQGVQFKLYGSDGAGNIDVSREVTDISGRNIFETDANGLLFSDYIRKGTYYLREIKTVYPYEVPDAPNGDVKVDLYIGNIRNKEQGNDFYITDDVTNPRAFVNLEGFAWEDILPEIKSVHDLNGLYDTDEGAYRDKLLNGISVKLCYNGNEKYLDPNDYKPGSIDKEEYTRRTDTTGNAGEGKYSFKAIRIDDLANYYVEFYYNGMCYENVKVADIIQNKFDIASNGNKASEGSARQQFNNKFRTITTNAANGGKSNGGLDLTYSSSNTQSTLTYGGKYELGWGGNDPNKPVAGVDAQYIISANTNNGYPAGTPQGLTKFVTADFIRQNGIEVIPNINLGIQKRKEVDLSIAKDLNCIELRINGATHVYTYNQVLRDLINNDTADNNIFTQRPNVGILFGNESYRGSYHRAIYEADLNYVDPIKDDNKNNELEAYVTYQIAIANRGGVAAQVNSIIDYFDANYQIDAIGTGLNGNKQITGNINNNNVAVDSNTNSGYRKCTINIPEQRIDAGKTKRNLYIRFKLNRNAIITAINEAGDSNNQRNKNLDNIVEIASYTTFNNMNDNTTFGGIDINSNPGNYSCPNQYFEDDTDTSPSLKLELNGERTLSGTVFVDSTGNLALRTGEVREGNGQLDNGESGVAGVEVTLKEISGTGKSYTETTNNYGNFTIRGYIPGEYELTYKWGNNKYTLNEKEETITVQDYKGTVYNVQRYQRNLTDSYWYKNETERYSDALDNYDTRGIVDSQMKNINNKKAYEIETQKDKIDNYKMISTTPKMKMEIELTDFRESEEGRGIVHIYDVEKVDFGIAERARQAVELNKRISRLRIVKENGEVQVDAKVVKDEDAQGNLKGYKLEKPVQYVTYIPASNAANGQLKVEIDNEIIQGSTLEITYDLQIRNISELDYANVDFYWHGTSSTNRNNPVKATARKIIDYLNNEIIVTSPDPESDKIDIYQTVSEKLKHIDNKVHDPNKEYLLEYSEALYNLLNNSKDRIAILHNENPELEPNQTTDIFLVTSRVLTNNVDMVVNNEAELVEIEKTGGSSLRVGVSTSVIPGNYIPGTEQHEVDDSSAEQGIITPPTGLSTDIVMYIILTVTALGITVIGIVLIKKYVMK